MNKLDLSVIRPIAKTKGIKMREIAKSLGISDSALQNIIKNNGTTLENLGKLADILKVSVGVFYGEKIDYGFEKIYANILNEIIIRYKDEIKKGCAPLKDLPQFNTIEDFNNGYDAVIDQVKNIVENLKKTIPIIEVLAEFYNQDTNYLGGLMIDKELHSAISLCNVIKNPNDPKVKDYFIEFYLGDTDLERLRYNKEMWRFKQNLNEYNKTILIEFVKEFSNVLANLNSSEVLKLFKDWYSDTYLVSEDMAKLEKLNN